MCPGTHWGSSSHMVSLPAPPYEGGLHSAVSLVLLICSPPQGCRGPRIRLPSDPSWGDPGMETSLPHWSSCALGASNCHFTEFTTNGGTSGLGYYFSYTMKGPGGTLSLTPMGRVMHHRYFQYRLTNKQTEKTRGQSSQGQLLVASRPCSP